MKASGNETGQTSSTSDLKALEYRRTEALQPHPLHGTIYRRDDIEELVLSIDEMGILTPLLITASGVIISGHRRLAAAKELGLAEVPVVVGSTGVKEEVLGQVLVESNVFRSKTTEDLLREYAHFLEREKERAKSRRGKKTALTAGQNNLRANSPTSRLSGRARDIAAKEVGMSPRTAEDGLQVIRAIDKHAEERDKTEELRKVLNEKSINASYELATEWGWIKKDSQQAKASPPEENTLERKMMRGTSASEVAPGVAVQEPGAKEGAAKTPDASRGTEQQQDVSERPEESETSDSSVDGFTQEKRTISADGSSTYTKAENSGPLTTKAVLAILVADTDYTKVGNSAPLESFVHKLLTSIHEHLGSTPSLLLIQETAKVCCTLGELLLREASGKEAVTDGPRIQ